MTEPRLDLISRLSLRDGVWMSSADPGVSYPNEGNERCFAVEDASFWFRHRRDCIIEAVRNFPPDGPLLDVGGGNGHVAIGLERAGFEAIVLEPGLRGIENARRRGLSRLVRSTLSGAGFADSSLRAVGVFDVLEHIEDDLAFIGEITRCLASGAKLYLTVPAHPWLWSRDDVESGHFRRYHRDSIHRLVSSGGLRVLYSTHLFSLLPPVIFLRRTIPTWLGRRKRGLARAESEHQVGRANRALSALLSRELGAIRRRGVMRFGSSILAVAEKTG